MAEGVSSSTDSPAFVWKIMNFSKLRTNKLYSDVFVVGGNKWRLVLFPKGNKVYDHLSLYLSVADSSPLSAGWSRDTTEWFSIIVVNQIRNENSFVKSTRHRFNATEDDWGFTSFMPLAELHDPAKGYLVDDTLVVDAVFSSALTIIIKVSRDEDLREQIGINICFDIVDHEKVYSFHVPKVTPFRVFKDEVAKEFGIPVKFLRFWSWAERNNKTYRPHRCLTSQEEAQSIEELRLSLFKTGLDKLNLFLEVELGLDSHTIAPPTKTEDDILIFFKLYDPRKRQLRYVGRLFVKRSGLPIEILGKLNQMAGFACDEEIELYEEIRFYPSSMCEHLDKRISFAQSQIGDGDIIWLQRSPSPTIRKQCLYPDVPSFLEYALNRVLVHFRSLDKPKEDDFCLELSKLHSYDDAMKKVANQIGLDDPSQIRLTSHNCNSQQPEPQPIKYTGVEHLSDMLVRYNQTSVILYYEAVDKPLPELEGPKTLIVAFHHASKDAVVVHNIRVREGSTVADIINKLKTKVELSHPNAELRLLEIYDHKICKIFQPNGKIENVYDQCRTLRAEEIPEEEKNLGRHDWLIHVYHFTKDLAHNQMHVQNFGDPFFLVIHEGETLGEVKVRVRKKLQVPGEEFAKWRFAFVLPDRLEYLHDFDIVFARFQKRDVYGALEQYLDLGLEHSTNAPKQPHAKTQIQRPPDTTPSVSLPAPSMSSRSSSSVLENLKNLLVGISSTERTSTQSNTSSSGISSSESNLPPNPQSLQHHRRSLQDHLASALEDIEQANAFDEIERIALVLIQHSSNSLEKTILKNLVAHLAAFKEMVPAAKVCMEGVRAQKAFLAGKKADVGARLDQALARCCSLETKFSKLSEEERELEARISRLSITQKEELLMRKNSLALELEKFNVQVTKDVEEWKVISEETEEAINKWLQVRETLAHGNLKWKLFKQNLERCEKFV